MKQLGKIDVYGLSIRGEEHDDNHDHFAIADLNKSMQVHQTNLSIDDHSRVHGENQGHVFLVADGLSSKPAPSRASQTAIDSIVHYFLNELPWLHLADGDPQDVMLALDDALKNSQDELLRTAPRGKTGMGTTMTLAFVSWPNLYLAHVGANRCYLQRDQSVRRLTTDHTLGVTHSDASLETILWNTIGGRGSEVYTEVRHMTLQPGDVLALVTDGVSLADEAEMQRALAADVSAQILCGRLVQGRGSDDRTAIVVRFLPTEPIEAPLVEAPSDRLEAHQKGARNDDRQRAACNTHPHFKNPLPAAG